MGVRLRGRARCEQGSQALTPQLTTPQGRGCELPAHRPQLNHVCAATMFRSVASIYKQRWHKKHSDFWSLLKQKSSGNPRLTFPHGSPSGAGELLCPLGVPSAPPLALPCPALTHFIHLLHCCLVSGLGQGLSHTPTKLQQEAGTGICFSIQNNKGLFSNFRTISTCSRTETCTLS